MARAIRDTDFMDDSDVSGVDGDLVKYAVEYGPMGSVNPNVNENSALGRDMMGDEFYDAEGEKPTLGGDDFYDAKSEGNDTFADDTMPDSFDGGEDYSNLTLINKKKRAKLKKSLKKAGKDIGKFAKSGLGLLAGGGAAAGQMSAPPPPPEPTRKGWSGLSTGAKAAIVVGGLAVVGTIGYFLLKKKN